MNHKRTNAAPSPRQTERRPYPNLRVSPEQGLSSEQARQLLADGWGNTPVEAPTKSDKEIIRENIFTYFNLIFVVLAVCLFLVGDWKNTTFLFVVAAQCRDRHFSADPLQARHRKTDTAFRKSRQRHSGRASSLYPRA